MYVSVLNETLRIETVDNNISTSNYFYLTSGPGEGLDNIMVSDSIDLTPPLEPHLDEPAIFPMTYLLLVVLILSGASALGGAWILRRPYHNPS